MNKYLVSDEWSIIEAGFDPGRHEASESIFSIGNGHMGQRANFEERYSGETLQGSYVAGIYYPDKTRVGWWKNGYPEYFAKVLNSPNWIGIDVQINGNHLDLAQCKTEEFRRVLSMQEGILSRSFIATMPGGERIGMESQRFVSMATPEIGVIKYSVAALKNDIRLSLAPYLDGDVRNKDSNYNEPFWNILETESGKHDGFLLAQTRKLDFRVGFAMKYHCERKNGTITAEPTCLKKPTNYGK
jgi:maltose phosphorylase